MNKLVAATCGLWLGLSLVSASQAADGRTARVTAELKARFAKADVNGDGKLTRDEAKGVMPRVHAHFDEIDANHAGYLSLAEIENFATAKFASKTGPL